jgi:hypothetical protein
MSSGVIMAAGQRHILSIVGKSPERKKKNEVGVKKLNVLSSFQTILMKESQHQAPFFALCAFAVKFSW